MYKQIEEKDIQFNTEYWVIIWEQKTDRYLPKLCKRIYSLQKDIIFKDSFGEIYSVNDIYCDRRLKDKNGKSINLVNTWDDYESCLNYCIFDWEQRHIYCEK